MQEHQTLTEFHRILQIQFLNFYKLAFILGFNNRGKGRLALGGWEFSNFEVCEVVVENECFVRVLDQFATGYENKSALRRLLLYQNRQVGA